MTQDGSSPGEPPEDRANPSETAPAKAEPQKKRRRIVKSVLLIVALVVLLIVIAPLLLSSSLGRAIVLEQLNDRLINGKLNVHDWSIGWFGPLRVEGLELTDANNVHLASVSEIDSPISLARVVTGRLNLGDVTISGADINAVVDPHGQLNLAQVFKTSGNGPTKLPNIKGVIHLQNITGTLQDDPGRCTLGIDSSHPLSATFTIEDINQPIEDNITLDAQLNERDAGTIKMAGSIGAISNNLLLADRLRAHQTMEMSGAGAQPDRIDIDMDVPWNPLLAGTGNVKVAADLGAANLAGAFPRILHIAPGVRLDSGRLTSETTVAISDGKAQIASQMHLSGVGGVKSGQPIRLNDVNAVATMTVVGGPRLDARDINVSLTSAFAEVGGGGESLGKLNIHASADLANLQKQLGQIVDLNAQMSGIAALNLTTNGDATGDGIPLSAQFKASGVKIMIPGRRAISEPALTATLTGSLQRDRLNDLALAISSPAANLHLTGEANLGGRSSLAVSQGTLDLRLAQEEFGGALSWLVPPTQADAQPTLLQMIADNSLRIASGTAKLSGKWESDGNHFGFTEPLTIRIAPSDVTVVDEMGTVQTMHLPESALTVSGNGTAGEGNLTVGAAIGTAAQPLLASRISADVQGIGSAVQFPRIQLEQCDADLAGLQATFGPLLPTIFPSPAMESGGPSITELLTHGIVQCTSGRLSASMLASYDGSTFAISRPLAISIANLTLQQSGGTTPIAFGHLDADVRAFSCPTDLPANQIIASLVAGGNLRIDSLQTKGITVLNLNVPFSVTGGVLRTVDPEQQTPPPPAACNSGSLDIGAISIDLRHDPMLLSMIDVEPGRPHQILKDVSLNPALAGTIFGQILNNPAFADAQSSRGLADVWIVQCRDVPLGDLFMQDSPTNRGFVEARYSIHEMQLGSALLAALANPSVSAEIDNADVLVQGGKMTEDSTLMIDQTKPLRIAGVVILASKRFAPMTAYISTGLLGKLIPLNVKQFMPDQIVVPMTGDVNHPKLELDKAVGQAVADSIRKALLGGDRGTHY